MLSHFFKPDDQLAFKEIVFVGRWQSVFERAFLVLLFHKMLHMR